jgi:hypothetical protein
MLSIALIDPAGATSRQECGRDDTNKTVASPGCGVERRLGKCPAVAHRGYQIVRFESMAAIPRQSLESPHTDRNVFKSKFIKGKFIKGK